jgi:GNAT superfamily N-acetyltransferase
VIVRSASLADAGEIARIHVEAWRAAYAGLLPKRILDGLTVTGRESQWRVRLSAASRGPRTMTAERGPTVLGFVTYVIPSRDVDEPRDVGEIPALYVDPAAWRTGAGTALVAAAEAHLAAGGCREGILWMLQGNTARRFYEAQGWHDDKGRRPSQYFPQEASLEEVRFRKALG